MNIIDAIVVFFVYGIYDLLLTVYTIKSNQFKKLSAAIAGSLPWGLTALNILAINRDPYLVLPGMLGAFVFIYVYLWYEENHGDSKFKLYNPDERLTMMK